MEKRRWRGDVCPIDVSDLLIIPGMRKIVAIARRDIDDVGVQELCDDMDKMLRDKC